MVAGIVAVILAARAVLVPADFGAHDRGYMYGFHRLGNEADWKAQEPLYKTDSYCEGCHPDKVEMRASSPHVIIPCEDCHGPAGNHPDDPPKLAIDPGREQCLRCHAYLPYPTSGRAVIRGIDPEKHNPGMECRLCHNPHNPVI